MRQLKVRIGAMMRFAEGLRGAFIKVVKCYVRIQECCSVTRVLLNVCSGTSLLVKDVIGLHKCDTHSHFENVKRKCMYDMEDYRLRIGYFWGSIFPRCDNQHYS